MPDMTNNQKSKKFFANTQWLIAIYDLIIFIVAAIPIDYHCENDGITHRTMMIFFAMALICTTVMRLLWKCYLQVWRYGSVTAYLRLVGSDGCAFLLCFAMNRFLPVPMVTFWRIISFYCLALLGCLTIRMLYRFFYRSCHSHTKWGRVFRMILRLTSCNQLIVHDDPAASRINVAVVGAGSVGALLAAELADNTSSGCEPQCFVDVDPDKIGRLINGLPVLAEDDVDSLRERFHIQEVILAVPQMDAEEKNALYLFYKERGFIVKTYDYPVMQQSGEGKRQLRDFDVEDLLFRKPLDVVDKQTASYYRDKVILVTGGGGSIGSELCRQVAKMSPRQIVILDVFENGAYDLQQDLKRAYGDRLDLQVEILSICDRGGLENIYESYHPQVVIHAAAHKHVPLMEHNCCEAIENNVFGTLNVVELSRKYGVGHFMMVSTDKAVNPTNVMGATKRMCEMIVQAHSAEGTATSFSATRFGNVLGSAGSVIPLFKRQITAGGPVTITDRRIIRYFMTIPEAAQLVLRAGAMAKSGELFVLDMGKPVKIIDLAETMIRLMGMEPYRDIAIREIGLRPGEKLYEELLVKTEKLAKTASDKIFLEKDEPISMAELQRKLDDLRQAVDSRDNDRAREALHRVIPTYHTPEEVNAQAVNSAEMQQV